MEDVMTQSTLWKNWTDEDWRNAVFCEDCGLPMLMTDPNEEGIGGYQCPYCFWLDDQLTIEKSLTAQVERLTKAMDEIATFDWFKEKWEGTRIISGEDYERKYYDFIEIARHARGKDTE